MKLMTSLAPSATSQIKADHTAVLALFHRLKPDTAAPVREALLRRICTSLEIHAALEEELFYPAVRDARVESAALERSVPEHDEMRRLITQLRTMPSDREAQDVVLCELMNAVMHHMADEETQVLPAAEQLLGRDRLAEIGARMVSRRLELAKPHVGEMGADMARSAPGRTAMAAVAAVIVGAWVLGRGHHAQHGRHA